MMGLLVLFNIFLLGTQLPLFGAFLVCRRCCLHDSGRYVVPTNNFFLDVCMCVVLNLVMLFLYD